MTQSSKRPIGVIVSTCLLAAVGCLEFVLLFIAIIGIILTLNGGIYFGSTPRPGWINPWEIPVAALLLGFFLWSGYTLVGLLRRKRWARSSMMLKGAALTVFGGWILVLCVIGYLHPSPYLTKQQALQQRLFDGPFFFYLAFFVLGVGWVVYFNLPGVKLYFLNNQSLAKFPSEGGPDTVEP